MCSTWLTGLTLAPEDSDSLAKLQPIHMLPHLRSCSYWGCRMSVNKKFQNPINACTYLFANMPTYMHVKIIYLFMCNYMHWWRFLEPSSFCSLTFCSLSWNEIEDEGACALAGALQVNQSLQELKWVQVLVNTTFPYLCPVTLSCSQTAKNGRRVPYRFKGKT